MERQPHYNTVMLLLCDIRVQNKYNETPLLLIITCNTRRIMVSQVRLESHNSEQNAVGRKTLGYKAVRTLRNRLLGGCGRLPLQYLGRSHPLACVARISWGHEG